VVQLYIQDLVGSVVRPVKELKGFEKIALEPGQSQAVTFTISSGDLAFYTRDMSFKAEAGGFRLFIGTSSEDLQAKSFKLTAK
jgi:beta-glucosidase